MCLVLKNLAQYFLSLNKLIPFILPCSGGRHYFFFFNRSASDESFSSRNLPWFPVPRCLPLTPFVANKFRISSNVHVNQDNWADAKLGGSLFSEFHLRSRWIRTAEHTQSRETLNILRVLKFFSSLVQVKYASTRRAFGEKTKPTFGNLHHWTLTVAAPITLIKISILFLEAASREAPTTFDRGRNRFAVDLRGRGRTKFAVDLRGRGRNRFAVDLRGRGRTTCYISLYMSKHFRCYCSLRDLSRARSVMPGRPTFAPAWALMRNRTLTKPFFLFLFLFRIPLCQ